jgi:hypothetical protein
MRRDLIALPENSRVWIYQCDQFVTDEVATEIQEILYNFTMQWRSHGQVVESYAQLFHKKFLVFVADEHMHVSGCSIDSSVHIIQQMELRYNVSFFDRLNFAYLDNDIVKSIHSSEFKNAYQQGLISDDTLMFDNLVDSKETFIDRWLVPLNESWYKKFLN